MKNKYRLIDRLAAIRNETHEQVAARFGLSRCAVERWGCIPPANRREAISELSGGVITLADMLDRNALHYKTPVPVEFAEIEILAKDERGRFSFVKGKEFNFKMFDCWAILDLMGASE